jgi:hypothetical protein
LCVVVKRQGLRRKNAGLRSLDPVWRGERELINYWQEGQLPLYTWSGMAVVAEHKSSQVFALVNDGDFGFTMDTTSSQLGLASATPDYDTVAVCFAWPAA